MRQPREHRVGREPCDGQRLQGDSRVGLAGEIDRAQVPRRAESLDQGSLEQPPALGAAEEEGAVDVEENEPAHGDSGGRPVSYTPLLPSPPAGKEGGGPGGRSYRGGPGPAGDESPGYELRRMTLRTSSPCGTLSYGNRSRRPPRRPVISSH